ncbi:hypothetical protein [Streptomyces sp. NRRL S-350]|uniref:hypothetical protein n=1 Tax=Streptomyces sp. NRRL S-350 TaxID=1463902 RepID=UPI0004BE95DD|nr:hypothetical protein [Streptomyces sp. NRRL S-350]
MNLTDVITPPEEAAGAVLARVAETLRTAYPGAALGGSVYGLLFAEAYKAVDAEAEAGLLAQIALRLLPEITGGITRGEYALVLLKAARAAGYEWTEADNEPVIPSIPGFPHPRKEQPAKGPEDLAEGPRGPKDQPAPGGSKGPRAEVAA